MSSAMTALATITLGSAQSTVTFSSIPATYRDLRIVLNVSGVANDIAVTFNGDSGSNYSRVYMAGQGAGSTASGSDSSTTRILFAYAGSGVAPSTLDIMDYSATDKHKTTISRGSDTAVVIAVAGRWASTSAITSVTITSTGSNFAIGSMVSLYGIAS